MDPTGQQASTIGHFDLGSSLGPIIRHGDTGRSIFPKNVELSTMVLLLTTKACLQLPTLLVFKHSPVSLLLGLDSTGHTRQVFAPFDGKGSSAVSKSAKTSHRERTLGDNAKETTLFLSLVFDQLPTLLRVPGMNCRIGSETLAVMDDGTKHDAGFESGGVFNSSGGLCVDVCCCSVFLIYE